MQRLFTQTSEYLKWHEALGRNVFSYKSKDNENNFSAYGVVLKTKMGNVLYFPFGPTFPDNISKETIEEFKKEVKIFARKKKCFFVRYENKLISKFSPPRKSYIKEGMFQPRVEWWKNLVNFKENEYYSDEEILNSFSKNHRYSVRKAEKENVEIEIFHDNFSKYKNIFFEILKETGTRDEFIIQDEKYLEQVLESIENGNMGNGEFKGFLAFSKVDEKYNSVALVLIYENVANFIYGGSTNYKRESGATVKLQFECMKEAKKMMAQFYNFGGIYEKGWSKKSLENLTKYKKQYAGFVKFHGPFRDMPINKFKYLLYILRKLF